MLIDYINLTKDDLLAKYIELTEMQVHMERELGISESEKHRTFMRAYVQSAGGNVAAKNRDADNATMEEEIELIRLRSEITAIHLQRELVSTLIDQRA
jgi:hypothetical protein